MLGATAQLHAAVTVTNLTGLPTYPNLNTGHMDNFTRTDTLGHRCTRFAATTFDALSVVQLWYRQAMAGASETDLANDANYGKAFALSGIKLAWGVDSAVIYQLVNQSAINIELFRCSA